jgi:hypothetical protein
VSVTAYPLTWPEGWPRTKVRERARFRTTLAGALKELRTEVRLLAGEQSARTLVLSSNVTLGAEHPADPGVVAYFTYEQKPVAIPCDRWQAVADNAKAIALTINAMRGMERWGAKHMIRAMFQGFAALPAPDDWRAQLGHPTTLTEAEAAFRERARSAHPDAGGSHEAMASLNRAIDRARTEFAAGTAR